jgi:hypothetical protein
MDGSSDAPTSPIWIKWSTTENVGTTSKPAPAAAKMNDADLTNAARQIRELYAAAQQAGTVSFRLSPRWGQWTELPGFD